MKCPCDNLKDKNRFENLDYVFDWAPETNGRECADGDYLEPGEIITSFTVVIPSGITSSSSMLIDSDTAVEVWLAAGTPGVTYEVICAIVTNLGRTAVRNLYLTIT